MPIENLYGKIDDPNKDTGSFNEIGENLSHQEVHSTEHVETYDMQKDHGMEIGNSIGSINSTLDEIRQLKNQAADNMNADTERVTQESESHRQNIDVFSDGVRDNIESHVKTEQDNREKMASASTFAIDGGYDINIISDYQNASKNEIEQPLTEFTRNSEKITEELKNEHDRINEELTNAVRNINRD